MSSFSFLNNDPHGGNRPPFEFSQITDQVFIGTNACCKAHFEDKLLKLGISADISLEEERIDHPYGVETYLWLPTKDHAPPSRDNAEIGIAALEVLLAHGRQVYIHCKNGHGRAPTFFGAYLVAKGFKPDQAIAAIKAQRPATHLEDSQRAFLESLTPAP